MLSAVPNVFIMLLPVLATDMLTKYMMYQAKAKAIKPPMMTAKTYNTRTGNTVE